MSQLTAPAPTVTTAGRTAWRVAGGLGLAHVVLLLGAFSLEGVASAVHGAAPATVLDSYAGLSVTRVEVASYAEALSFLVLVPALVLLARLFTGSTETGRVASGSFLALGVAYVAATLAIGFPPLTTAVYAAHHGADATLVATINDLRNYGFMLQVALSAGSALALGIAARAGRIHPRWVGWVGIGVGAVGLVVAPVEYGLVSMAWLVWWVGLCVLCLRCGPAKP